VVYVTGEVIHVTGRVDADGHLFDLWEDGAGGWRKDDITALARDLAPAMPAATYSPCVCETSTGVAIAFRAVGGDLWVITRNDNAPTNLMTAVLAPKCAGHPTCFVLADKLPHFVYRAVDQSVNEIWLEAGTWHTRQICTMSAASDPVAASDGTSVLVAVRTSNGVIQAAQFNGTSWTCTATMSAPPAPSAASGDLMGDGGSLV
jgi:hypothetical protein